MTRTAPESGSWARESLESIPLPESLHRPDLLVVKMDNASMEPGIRRDALVGIDCAEAPLRSGEIYALDMPGEGLIINASSGIWKTSGCSSSPTTPATRRSRSPWTIPESALSARPFGLSRTSDRHRSPSLRTLPSQEGVSRRYQFINKYLHTNKRHVSLSHSLEFSWDTIPTNCCANA